MYSVQNHIFYCVASVPKPINPKRFHVLDVEIKESTFAKLLFIS